jgi:phosphatidate cytidylyltransferase
VLDRALQQRILTALLLAPLAVAGMLLLPTAYFALALGLVLLLGAWEWTRLAGIAGQAARFVYVLLAGVALGLAWAIPAGRWLDLVLALLSVWWARNAFVLYRTEAIEPAEGVDAALLPVGLMVLAGCWLAVVHLHGIQGRGPWLVLFLFVLIWTADTAAYFVGRRWGRSKLAPVVSPGKTRAGLYGALAGASACGLVLGWGLGLSPGGTVLAVAICALTALISVVGDLYESLLKRRRGLKDAGTLLPGHGGVLDRLDSLIAAAPLFALGVLWLEASL